MNIKEMIMDAIRENLKEQINEIDWSDVVNRIAEGAIEDEIGDIESEAAEYIAVNSVNTYNNKFGALGVLHELIDEALD